MVTPTATAVDAALTDAIAPAEMPGRAAAPRPGPVLTTGVVLLVVATFVPIGYVAW